MVTKNRVKSYLIDLLSGLWLGSCLLLHVRRLLLLLRQLLFDLLLNVLLILHLLGQSLFFFRPLGLSLLVDLSYLSLQKLGDSFSVIFEDDTGLRLGKRFGINRFFNSDLI